ncbi:hypothetical protein AGIG_G16546 [Arapaima gigas]
MQHCTYKKRFPARCLPFITILKDSEKEMGSSLSPESCPSGAQPEVRNGVLEQTEDDIAKCGTESELGALSSTCSRCTKPSLAKIHPPGSAEP